MTLRPIRHHENELYREISFRATFSKELMECTARSVKP